MPGLWIVAQGGAASVLLHLASTRLDLQIAGAVLVAPRSWTGRRDRLALPEVPLPFPLLLAEREGGGLPISPALAHAWAARPVPNPFAQGPAFRAALSALTGSRGAQPSTAAKSRRDLASSTAEIASRTSSMVSRTAQVASSGQSVQAR